MNEIVNNEYKKAYVELNEIINNMSVEEKNKIPEEFIKKLNAEMDREYKFVFDKSKSILEQDFRIETKALLVELYEKYMAPDVEKEFWHQYDKICLDMIDKKKQLKYNSNNIFNSSNIENENNLNKNEKEEKIVNLPIEVKERNIFVRFVQVIKRLFHIK